MLPTMTAGFSRLRIEEYPEKNCDDTCWIDF
jgi:hypothetical protein